MYTGFWDTGQGAGVAVLGCPSWLSKMNNGGTVDDSLFDVRLTLFASHIRKYTLAFRTLSSFLVFSQQYTYLDAIYQ